MTLKSLFPQAPYLGMALVALGHLTHLGTDTSQNSVCPSAEFLLPWEGRSSEAFGYLQLRYPTCSY